MLAGRRHFEVYHFLYNRCTYYHRLVNAQIAAEARRGDKCFAHFVCDDDHACCEVAEPEVTVDFMARQIFLDSVDHVEVTLQL
jgi:hypothetical protein